MGNRRLPNPEFPLVSCIGFPPPTPNFQAHSAPSQAVFYTALSFPDRYRGALFVSFHGSWNRVLPTGYKVVAVIFSNGVSAVTEDFVTGWLTDDYRVLERPVGVAVAADGSPYVSDDHVYLFYVTYGRGDGAGRRAPVGLRAGARSRRRRFSS